MKLIVSYVGRGNYSVPEDSEEQDVVMLERTLSQVKLSRGFPFGMKSQPRKIILVINNDKGIINFVI